MLERERDKQREDGEGGTRNSVGNALNALNFPAGKQTNCINTNKNQHTDGQYARTHTHTNKQTLTKTHSHRGMNMLVVAILFKMSIYSKRKIVNRMSASWTDELKLK